MDVKFSIRGFEFSFFIDTTTGDTQRSVAEQCSHVQIALATFQQYNLTPDVKTAQPTNGATGGTVNNGWTEETWTATKLRHGFFNNKHTFNICGGRWEQFGVPIYDDIQDIDPILKQDIFSRPLGDSPFARQITALIGADGKPKKVKKVE